LNYPPGNNTRFNISKKPSDDDDLDKIMDDLLQDKTKKN
jgi:hypothetical protein